MAPTKSGENPLGERSSTGLRRSAAGASAMAWVWSPLTSTPSWSAIGVHGRGRNSAGAPEEPASVGYQIHSTSSLGVNGSGAYGSTRSRSAHSVEMRPIGCVPVGGGRVDRDVGMVDVDDMVM